MREKEDVGVRQIVEWWDHEPLNKRSAPQPAESKAKLEPLWVPVAYHHGALR